MTDPFLKDCIKDLKVRGIGPPFYCQMPCGKRVWFDIRGRILATSTTACVRLAHDMRWKKNALEMSVNEYEKAKAKYLG